MARKWLAGTGLAVVGAVVTVLGTVWHRATWPLGTWRAPLGLVMALLLVLATMSVGRALVGWAGILGAGAGVIITSQLVALVGPGGDFLVQADLTGYAWLLGAPAAALVAALLPRAWFSPSPQ